MRWRCWRWCRRVLSAGWPARGGDERFGAAPHGGRALELARELGCPLSAILDFSASLNPLGPPQEALAAARAALDDASHYPESDATTLAGALAARHGLPRECLLAGAGATEFIFLVPRVLRPRRVLLVEPAFGEYRPALQQAGALIDPFQLVPATGFRLDPALFGRPAPGYRPGMAGESPQPERHWLPTRSSHCPRGGAAARGVAAGRRGLRRFRPALSVADQAATRTNLVVLRSLTKFYAVAGLRVGWLAAAPALAARLAAAANRGGCPPGHRRRPGLPQGRGLGQGYAGGDPVLREELAAGLERLGCTVYPSVANYLLCRLPDTVRRPWQSLRRCAAAAS